MKTTIELLKEIFKIRDNWTLAYRICEEVGEKNPSWIQAVYHAIESGDVPGVATDCLRIVQQRIGGE